MGGFRSKDNEIRLFLLSTAPDRPANLAKDPKQAKYEQKNLIAGKFSEKIAKRHRKLRLDSGFQELPKKLFDR